MGRTRSFAQGRGVSSEPDGGAKATSRSPSCKFPWHSEPTCSDTAPTQAMDELRTFAKRAPYQVLGPGTQMVDMPPAHQIAVTPQPDAKILPRQRAPGQPERR